MKVGLVRRAVGTRGGVSVAFCEWAEQLEAAGHEVIVFSSKLDDRIYSDGWTYVPVALHQGGFFDRAGFAFAVRLYRELRLHPVDVVLCLDSTAYFGAWLGARRLQVPAIMIFQGWIYSPGTRGAYPRSVTWAYKLAVHFSARYAPLVACLNREIYDGLLSQGARPERLWLAPNCVELKRWRTDKVGAHRRDAREVLYVGGLRRVKGVDVLLHAIPTVLERLPGVRFRLLGGAEADDGLYHEMARHLCVDGCVDFGGSVPREQLLEVYASADVMVSPSRAEGHALAVVECLACGTPVVASDIPGLRESVRHEENGLLVRPQDPVSLADAICRILGDHALLDRLSRAARPSVERFSGWAERIREFEEHVACLRGRTTAPAEAVDG